MVFDEPRASQSNYEFLFSHAIITHVISVWKTIDFPHSTPSVLRPGFFPGRLTHGGIFNNRLMFQNNRILFSLLFSGNFCGGDKTLGKNVVIGDPPVLPLTRENPDVNGWRSGPNHPANFHRS